MKPYTLWLRVWLVKTMCFPLGRKGQGGPSNRRAKSQPTAKGAEFNEFSWQRSFQIQFAPLFPSVCIPANWRGRNGLTKQSGMEKRLPRKVDTGQRGFKLEWAEHKKWRLLCLFSCVKLRWDSLVLHGARPSFCVQVGCDWSYGERREGLGQRLRGEKLPVSLELFLFHW